ncbi:MAG: hypothetical protein AAF667_06615 [Pseudomonadota bacterium]
MSKKIFEKLSRWLIFSVAISLVPLIFAAISLASRGSSVELIAVIGNGELLIISTSMCAAAVGELFGAGQKYKYVQVILGGLAVLLLMLSALNFADIAAVRAAGSNVVSEVLRSTSIVIFLASVVVSCGCIVVSEIE